MEVPYVEAGFLKLVAINRFNHGLHAVVEEGVVFIHVHDVELVGLAFEQSRNREIEPLGVAFGV